MQGPRNTAMWTWLAAVILVCQALPNTRLPSKTRDTGGGLSAECVGNIMRLSLDKALAVGNQLEVEAINGSGRVVLTPALAAQCGYSMESDPWGNTRIYTSLLGCYVHNTDDVMFRVGLKLDMFNPFSPEIISHSVDQTCTFSDWKQREVLCERNYMEVSHRLPEASSAAHGAKDDPQMNALPASSVNGDIWKLTFHGPQPSTMVQKEAEQAGYGARTTANRLVLRSSYHRPETYTEEVAGIPMEVLRVGVYYSAPSGLSVMDMTVACPIGGVLFSPERISWHVPRSVVPVVDGAGSIAELYLGVNGQRLDPAQLSARGYSLTTRDVHIVVDIPVGSSDGYYKSHAPQQQYHVTFSVEPMLEVLWRTHSGDETRYKVLFPITTPLTARPPQATDQTVAESRFFSLLVGTFLPDVELKNITFSTGTFTVEECVKRGFTVEQVDHGNGTMSFSVRLGFDEDVVMRHNPEPLVTVYTLPLTLGFMISPEQVTFSLTTELVTSLHDVVHPTVTASCDQEKFHVIVAYGNQGSNFETFETLVGYRVLTAESAMEYDFRENATHFHFSVPYLARDTGLEMLVSDSVQTRLEIVLWDPKNLWSVGDLVLICHFPFETIRCLPDGSVNVVAMKLLSVPQLDVNRLRLRDRSCRPVQTTERSATFSFTVDSCGTTRKFVDDLVVYENEISVDYGAVLDYRALANRRPRTSPLDPEYRQRVVCYYRLDQTLSLGFGSVPGSAPTAETGSGSLSVHMRMATDRSFSRFFGSDDFPLSKFLQEPLFLEVLLSSPDPQLQLLLNNCWATSDSQRDSEPRWDLILDTCANPDDRSLTELIPHSDSRLKRFSFRMFTFTRDDDVLSDQIHIHCDAVVCDFTDAACRGQCAPPSAPTRSSSQFSTQGGRAWSQGPGIKPKPVPISSGLVRLSHKK